MPRTYNLTVEIDTASLQMLRDTDMYVAIAKGTGTTRPNVAWLAWAPSGHDMITWTDTYGIYATHHPVEAGSILPTALTIYPAVERTVYPFLEDGFKAPIADPGIPSGHFDVFNLSSQQLTAGLLQSVVINGETVQQPLNAVALPHGFTADFASSTMVFIWTQYALNSGMLVTIPAEAAVVSFGHADVEICCRYDRETAAFSTMSDVANENPHSHAD